MNINIKSEKKESHYDVSIEGELDVYTAPELQEVLEPIKQEGTHDLKIDLTNLSYMDSTGLGIFVGTLKALNKNDKELYVYGASDRIARLFEITGLKDLMNFKEGEGQ